MNEKERYFEIDFTYRRIIGKWEITLADGEVLSTSYVEISTPVITKLTKDKREVMCGMGVINHTALRTVITRGQDATR